MSSIDNRVVKITFDNAQFEQKIKATQELLEKFEEKLKLENASKGFDKIKEAADKLNLSALSDKIKDETDKINTSSEESAKNIDKISKSAEKADFSSLGKGASKAAEEVGEASAEAASSISKIDSAADNVNFSSISESAYEAVADVNVAAGGVDLSPINASIEQSAKGFNAFEEIAIGALRGIGGEITDFVTNKLKGLAGAISEFTTQPITEGFKEYETQIGSIQTILANTGKDFDNQADINQVNDKLDELNLYADKTIYNFTEMVKAIGTFTSSGLDLDQATAAVKGSASAAALMGADTAAYTRVLPQISQALSADYVSLQDWSSFRTAGMNGKAFTDVIGDVAKHMAAAGKVDKSAGDMGQRLLDGLSMQSALNQQEYGKWLSSDILSEALQMFTYDEETWNANREEIEAHLQELGYTVEEFDEIRKRAEKASKAATEVRTFSQLMDTLKESIGSQWTGIWSNLLGDFKQATSTFTFLSESFNSGVELLLGGFVDSALNFKNSGAGELIFGGFIESMNEATGEVEKTRIPGALDNLVDAIGKPLTAIHDAFFNVFGMSADSQMEMFRQFGFAFQDFTASLVISDDMANGIQGVFEGIFSVVKLILALAGDVFQFLGWGIKIVRTFVDPILDIIATILGQIGLAIEWVVDKLLEVHDAIKVALEPFAGVIEMVRQFVEAFIDWLDIPGKIQVVGDAIGTFLTAIWNFIDIPGIIMAVGKVFSDIFGYIGQITGWNSAVAQSNKIFAETGQKVSVVDLWFKNLMKNPLIAFFVGIYNAVKNVVTSIGSFIVGLFKLNEEGNGFSLASVFRGLWEIVKILLTPVKVLFWLLGNGISAVTNGIGGLLQAVSNFGLFGAIKKFITDIPGNLAIAGEAITNFFDLIGKTLSNPIDFWSNIIDTMANAVYSLLDKLPEGLKNIAMRVHFKIIKTLHDIFDIDKLITDENGNQIKIRDLAENWGQVIVNIKQLIANKILDAVDAIKEKLAIFGKIPEYVKGMFDKVTKVFTDIANVFSSPESLGNAIQAFSDWLGKISEGLPGIIRWFIDGIRKGIINTAAKLLGGIRIDENGQLGAGFFNSWHDVFVNLKNMISQKIMDIIGSLGDKLGKIGTFFKGLFSLFDPNTTEESKKQFHLWINSYIEDFKALWRSLTDNPVVNKIVEIKDKIVKSLGDQTTFIGQAWYKTKNTVTDVVDFFAEKIRWIKDAIANYVGPVWESTRTWPEFISALFTKIKESLKQGIKDAVEQLTGIKVITTSDIFAALFTYIGEQITKLPGIIATKLAEAKDAVVKFIKGMFSSASNVDFGSTWLGFIRGLFDTFIEWAKAIPDRFVERYEKIKTSFNETFGTLGAWISEKFKPLVDAFESIKTWFKDKFTAVSDVIYSFFNVTEQSAKSLKEKIEEVYNNIKDYPVLGQIATAIKQGVDHLVDTAERYGNWPDAILDFLSDERLARIVDLFKTTAMGRLIANLAGIANQVKKATKNTSKALTNTAKGVTDSINKVSTAFGGSATRLSKSFAEVGTELKNVFKTYNSILTAKVKKEKMEKVKTIATSLLKVAGAIAILAAACWLLSTIPNPLNAIEVLGAVAAILVAMQFLSTAIEKWGKKHSGGDALIKTAASLGVFAISMLLLMFAVKRLNDFPYAENWKGILAAGACLVALGAITGLITRIGGKGGKSSIQAATAVLILIGSLFILVGALKSLNTFATELAEKNDPLSNGYLLAVLAGSLGIIYALGRIAIMMKKSRPIPTAIALVAMLGGLNKLVKALVTLSDDSINWGRLILSTIVIGLLMGEFGFMVSKLSDEKGANAKAAKSIGTALLLYSFAIIGMSRALKSLAKQDTGEIAAAGSALVAMVGIFGAIAYFNRTISKTTKKGTTKETDDSGKTLMKVASAVLIYSYAVQNIAKAIKTMSTWINKESLAIAGGVMIMMIFLLGWIANMNQVVSEKVKGESVKRADKSGGTLIKAAIAINLYSVGITILVGALSHLANEVNSTNLAAASTALGGLILVFGIVTKMVQSTSTLTNGDTKSKQATQGGKSLLQAGFAMMLYASALGIISLAIKNILDNCNVVEFAEVSAVMAGLIVVFGVIVGVTKNNTPKQILSIAGGFVIYAFAITIISEALKSIMSSDIEHDPGMIVGISAAIALLASVFGIFAEMENDTKPSKILAFAAGMLIYAGAIYTISSAIKNILSDGLSATDVVGAAVAISLVAAVFGIFDKMTKNEGAGKAPALAAAFLIYSGAIYVISAALRHLAESNVDSKELLGLVGCISLLVAMFGLLGLAFKSSEGSPLAIAAALLVYSIAISGLGAALTSLSEIDSEKLKAVTSCMVVFLLAAAAVGAIGKTVFAGMVLFSAGLAALSAALWIFGQVIQSFPDFDKVHEFGRSIIGGLIGGIIDGIGDAILAILNVCGRIFTAIANFFGIRSPSKLMREEIGENISAGIASGIDDGSKGVMNSIDDLNTGMAKELDTEIKLPSFVSNESSLADSVRAPMASSAASTAAETTVNTDSIDKTTDSFNSLSDATSSLDSSNLKDYTSSLGDLESATSSFNSDELSNSMSGLTDSIDTSGLDNLGSSLGNIGDITEGMNLDGFSDQLSGLNVSEDQLGSFDSLGDSLGDINSQMSDFGSLTDSMGGLEGVSDFGTSIADTLGEGLNSEDSTASSSLDDLLGNLFGQANNEENSEEAQSAGEGIAEEMGKGLAGGGGFISDAIDSLFGGGEGEDGETKSIGEKVKDKISGVIGDIFGGDGEEGDNQTLFGRIREKITTGFNDFITNFPTWVSETAIPAVGNAIGQFTQWMETTGGPAIIKFFTVDLPNWWNNTALPWLTGTAWPAVQKFAADAWEWIKTKAGELREKAAAKLNEWKEQFFEFLRGIPEWVKTKAGELWERIKNWFEEKRKGVAEWLEARRKQIEDFGRTIGENVSKFFDDIGRGIVDFVTGIPDRIAGAFESIVNTVGSLGTNIVNGLANGITGALNLLPGPIRDVCETALNGIKNFFGIRSPSKLMRDKVGRYIPEGMAIGIEKGIPSVVKAMSGIGSRSLSAIQSSLGIHSPSAVMEDEVGKNIDEGLALGIQEYSDVVEVAAENLGATTTHALNNVVSDASYDLEAPGIEPVFNWDTFRNDLRMYGDEIKSTMMLNSDELNNTIRSEVIVAMAEHDNKILEQLFDMGNGMNTHFNNVAEHITEISSVTSKIDELKEYIDTTNYILKSDIYSKLEYMEGEISDIQMATDSLSSKLSAGNNVYMDTGALVGAIAPEMDSALGYQQVSGSRTLL